MTRDERDAAALAADPAAVVGVIDGVSWTRGAVVVEIIAIADALNALEADLGAHPVLDEVWHELTRLSLSLAGVLPLQGRRA